MTALVISPAAILADIARRGGAKPPTPVALPERDRLIAVGVNPSVARFLAHRTRNVRFTPATTTPPKTQPCGTHAAYNRHRAHGETPDAACRDGERRYQKRRVAHRRLSTAVDGAVHDATVAA